ncbi:DNA-lyase [Tricharina praecox]|uniref:DNA-lyase n=1 Tax=Tricharina praecox TaxID=43433 RepID=UPI00221EB8F0|nr:DNA-lyase [Tricharina praecox]KAI5846765.1 DNA-lyase [Tricharina praecox]
MLATRLLNPRLLIGAHVSAAKGVQNAITNSLSIGGNSLALFLKSQRKWASPALSATNASLFRAACIEHNYNPATQILPHGSYLINLAQHDAVKAEQAYVCFLDDLQRCETLGIGLYNFHPGSTLGEPRDEALGRIAAALNRAHKGTTMVKTVVENMVGAGNVVGSSFEDLRDIIAGVTDKSRVGVCLDTCHLFAAGHDISTPAGYDQVMKNFDDIVGRQYLCALHLNDSKGPLGSKKDLHCNIGHGFLGLEAFRLIVNDARLHGLPMVLETPNGEDPGVWAKEIKLLESLVGMTGEEAEFKALVEELQELGRSERERVAKVVEMKAGKKERKPAQWRGRRKKVETEEEGSESEGSGCTH